jgi:tol-pal system protein YbgF
MKAAGSRTVAGSSPSTGSFKGTRVPQVSMLRPGFHSKNHDSCHLPSTGAVAVKSGLTDSDLPRFPRPNRLRGNKLTVMSTYPRLRQIVALAALALLVCLQYARAESKEMIQLRTQIQTLQDTLQQIQQGNAEKMGVLQHLVEQTADTVNKMSANMDALAQSERTQNDAISAKVDGVSGQVQALNDSVDELKTRMAGLSKAIQDLQAQSQTMAAQQPTQPGGAPGGGPQAGQNQPGAGQPAAQPATPQAPPVGDLYQSALRDYNSARYDVAGSEFGDVLRFYPQDDLAGNAQFYLGEIAYRQGNYQAAIKAYDMTVEQYSGNPKIPAAQLRKGEALIALNQREAGIRELRSLIQRYPQTPEAQQARSRLNAMGVRIAPAPKPAAGHD